MKTSLERAGQASWKMRVQKLQQLLKKHPGDIPLTIGLDIDGIEVKLRSGTLTPRDDFFEDLYLLGFPIEEIKIIPLGAINSPQKGPTPEMPFP